VLLLSSMEQLLLLCIPTCWDEEGMLPAEHACEAVCTYASRGKCQCCQHLAPASVVGVLLA